MIKLEHTDVYGFENEPVEPVETKDIYLHFEVQDMAEDEEGNPCPSGMKVCVTLEAYDILAAKLEALAATDERLLIHRLGLYELFGACKLRFITREEYERKYGD